jgi:hypothetical protein
MSIGYFRQDVEEMSGRSVLDVAHDAPALAAADAAKAPGVHA